MVQKCHNSTDNFSKPYIISCLLLGVVIQLIALQSNSFAQTTDRPNIVLLVSEDNSIHFMDHFHPGGAKAPNIETLAEAGIIFDRAFSNAPVCSVARLPERYHVD